MTTFNFRLASLLRLRESTRDRRRLELADAERADAELQDQLSRLDAEREQLQAQHRRLAGPCASIDLPRLVDADRYAVALRAQKDALTERRATLAAEIGRRRQTLIEADRAVRTLEKLRENQEAAHRQDQWRLDGKRLDEAALQTAEVLRDK